MRVRKPNKEIDGHANSPHDGWLTTCHLFTYFFQKKFDFKIIPTTKRLDHTILKIKDIEKGVLI